MLRWPAASSRSQRYWRDVGVLVLVDEDVAEPALVLRQHVGVALQDGEDVQQQVAEVAGVQRPQPLLVLGVELGALVVEGARLGGGHAVRGRARGSSSRRSGRRAAAAASASRRCGAAWTIWRSSRIWSSTSRMVKFDFSPTSSACRRRMRTLSAWKVPSQGMPSTTPPTSWPDPRLHLARRLVGEGDGEDLVRARPAGVQQVGDAGGQRPGLAGAGAGEHQHRAVERLDRGALVGVERVEVGRRARGDRGARRQRPRRGLEGFGLVVDPVRHSRPR